MKIDKAIKILEDWIKCEEILAKGRKSESNFDKFCKDRAKAIEIVLEELGNAYEQGFKDGANAAASDILGRI